MIQVIDVANLLVALVALIVSAVALLTAKSLQSKSVSAGFVLEKYFDVLKVMNEFTNKHKFKDYIPPTEFVVLARQLEPYKTVLDASGLARHYAAVSNISSSFEGNINKKGIELRSQGMTDGEIAESLGSEIDSLASDLRFALDALAGQIQGRISSLLDDPLSDKK